MSSPKNSGRIDGVDALRGFAVAMMIAYHFSYDLGLFGVAPWTTADMVTRAGWMNWPAPIGAAATPSRLR